MWRPLLLRFGSLVTAVALMLPVGAAQMLLDGSSVANAGSPACDTSLSLNPGGGLNLLADAQKNQPYGPAVITVGDGGGPIYHWQVTSGSLPPGLALSVDAQGLDDSALSITGIPTALGVYGFTLEVADYQNNNVCLPGDSKNYQIDVHAPGHVTIMLSTAPRSAVDVPFQADWGAFTLDNDPAASPPPGQKKFTVMPGTYDVVESDPVGWGFELTNISCTTDQVYDLPQHKMTIVVEDASDITCTFQNTFRRVDLAIAKTAAGPFSGTNIYAGTAQASQTVSRTGVGPGLYRYFVRIRNNGPQQDAFLVKATRTGSPAFSAKYFANNVNVTAAVSQGTWNTGNLLHGQSVLLEVRVTEQNGSPAGAMSAIVVRSGSVGRPDQVDVVRTITKR